MTLKSIEITTVRLVFDDTEPKEVKRTIEVQKVGPPIEAKPRATKPKYTKSGKHMWTDDEKKEAMRMYAEGEDLDVIANRFNSTKLSVMKIMQKAGVKRPWPTKGNPSKLEPQPEAEEKEPV